MTKFDISKLRDFIETLEKVKHLTMFGRIEKEKGETLEALILVELDEYVTEVIEEKKRARQKELSKAEQSDTVEIRKSGKKSPSSK